MFKELTFYLDSCDSCSMFPNLSASTENIYAMIATSDNEPACAVFYGGWARVNGKKLSKQYATVSKRTTNSSVS